jgi:hypothetical protein
LVVSSDSGVNAQFKHHRPVFNIKQVVRDAPLDFFRHVGLAAPAVAPRPTSDARIYFEDTPCEFFNESRDRII